MLVNGKTEITNTNMLEYMLCLATPESLEELPSPRILTTHRQFGHVPSDYITKVNICVLFVDNKAVIWDLQTNSKE